MLFLIKRITESNTTCTDLVMVSCSTHFNPFAIHNRTSYTVSAKCAVEPSWFRQVRNMLEFEFEFLKKPNKQTFIYLEEKHL